MSRDLTREDILNAKAVYLYAGNTIFVEVREDEVYGFGGSVGWYRKENFYDYFESSLMMSYFSSITKEEVIKRVEGFFTDKEDIL